MTHALRKTEGPFAAGTRVEVRGENRDGTLTVEVMVDANHTIGIDELVFDIDAKDVVKLRNKTDVVSSTSRPERREFLNKLFEGTKDVK
jgi:hypothetical protein